jgi:hypothetical protein
VGSGDKWLNELGLIPGIPYPVLHDLSHWGSSEDQVGKKTWTKLHPLQYFLL